jgi:hypothetical protein
MRRRFGLGGRRRAVSPAASLLLGAAFGGVLTALFDPARGRSRRAVARDRLARRARESDQFLGKAAADLEHRAHGLWVSLTRPRSLEPVPDERLVQRVRSVLGHVVTHPHAIVVSSDSGHVRLAGPVFTHEVGRLLRRVRAVPGVRSVETRLEVHDTAEGVPALQGAARQPAFGVLHRVWSPGIRLITGLFASVLVAEGLRRRGPRLAILGSAVLARALTDRPVREVVEPIVSRITGSADEHEAMVEAHPT